MWFTLCHPVLNQCRLQEMMSEEEMATQQSLAARMRAMAERNQLQQLTTVEVQAAREALIEVCTAGANLQVCCKVNWAVP